MIDLTTFVTGGFCSLMIANQGAEVIKVERSGSVSPTTSGKRLLACVGTAEGADPDEAELETYLTDELNQLNW